ncbi:MAG: hypothetical protein VYD41_00680, partial [Candidatus Thermoplasmatota archaeon]|nr:hypothetical protein [Candidatus Thermoplasmatota archaeon]
MRIHYDWRLARVVDEEGYVLDEIAWDGHRSHSSLADRLQTIKQGRALNEVKDLLERFPDAVPDRVAWVCDPSLPPLGEEDEKHLQGAAALLAQRAIASAAGA